MKILMDKAQKRAQGLSINFVIVAAIALVVLIVIIYLFGSKLGITGKELERCRLNAPCEATQACQPGYVDLGPCKNEQIPEGRCCLLESQFMQQRGYTP